MPDHILLEDGNALLQENGDYILLEEYILATIDLTLRSRDLKLTLQDRDTDLTLKSRSLNLTLPERE